MPEFGAPPPSDDELYDGPQPRRPTQAEIDKAVALPGETTNVIRPPLFSGRPPIEAISDTSDPSVPATADPIGVPRTIIELQPASKDARYLEVVSAALDVLSARLILLIAMLGGLAIWSVAIVAPEQLRLIAAAGYSALVILPAVYLHLRKG